MSTSDQQGNTPLTRKQLREIRLTGATPVVSEEAATAAAAEAPPVPETRVESAVEPESIVEPEPVVEPEPAVEPEPDVKPDADHDDAPLTRRQAREQERIRTASVPVITHEEQDTAADDELVSGVPSFATHGGGDVQAIAPVGDDDEDRAGDEDDLGEEAVDIAPVSAAAAADSTGDVRFEGGTSVDEPAVEVDDEPVVEPGEERAAGEIEVDPIAALGADADSDEDDDVPEAVELPVADPVETGESLVVSPTFGNGLLAEKGEVPSFTPSFDELITADSGGSQNLAPNMLIFTPPPGEGSLSGPVASTGEVLVTGSYEVPQGIGSRGHAHGTADGKEADAVLIDGELPPASSPTPIAASSAISTIKPAGEVIRPPAPEKGNKLMLTLAITAGGLALALAVALIFAFTTDIFS